MSSTATKTSPQEARRRQILEAAVRVFANKGFHSCRVSDIAGEAGVAYGLVYHYFESKDAVLESIFRQTWTDMLETINSVEELDESAREQLRKVIEIVLRAWKRDPNLVRVLVREVVRSEQMQRQIGEIELAFEALERIVERGQASGEFRKAVDPKLAAWILYGALEEILTGWALGRLDDKDEDVTAAEQAVLLTICDGLTAN